MLMAAVYGLHSAAEGRYGAHGLISACGFEAGADCLDDSAGTKGGLLQRARLFHMR